MDARLPDRPLRSALARGLRMRCPRCGAGALFAGYLTVRDACPSCREPLSGHRADDAPAWATMLIVGHLAIPALMLGREASAIPVWAQMIIWPLAAGAACLALLPRVKGAVVGWQWAQRMHGFGD